MLKWLNNNNDKNIFNVDVTITMMMIRMQMICLCYLYDNNNIIISRHTMIITTENFSTGCFEHYFFGTKTKKKNWLLDL